MKQFVYTIKAPRGIHIRPAGMLVKEAGRFASACTLTDPPKTVGLDSLLRLMSLGVRRGTTVIVSANGADEDDAIAALKGFFEHNL